MGNDLEMDSESNNLLTGRPNFAFPRLSRRRFLGIIPIPQQNLAVFGLITVPLALNLCLLINLLMPRWRESCEMPLSDYGLSPILKRQKHG